MMVFHLIDRLAADPNARVTALAQNEGVLAAKLRERGIQVVVVPEASTSFVGAVRKAFSAIRSQHFDVVHTHRYKENLLGFCLSKLLHVKVLVATMHGMPESPIAQRGRPRGLGVTAKGNHLLLRHAFSKVVVVSDDMRKVLVDRHGFASTDLEVIHNGITVPAAVESAEKREAGPLRIGTVGRFVPVKDYALFLEVAAAIAREAPDVRFSLLGDGPLKEDLRRKAENLGIGELVEFREPVPDPMSYYGSLDLYLSTSVHEGIPLSILEAMACGRPVVAPRVGGIPEIVSSDAEGCLVDSRRPEDFARVCLQLLGDRRRSIAMGRAARERVQSAFSDRAMADAYRDLYRGLLTGEVR